MSPVRHTALIVQSNFYYIALFKISLIPEDYLHIVSCEVFLMCIQKLFTECHASRMLSVLDLFAISKETVKKILWGIKWLQNG